MYTVWLTQCVKFGLSCRGYIGMPWWMCEMHLPTLFNVTHNESSMSHPFNFKHVLLQKYPTGLYEIFETSK